LKVGIDLTFAIKEKYIKMQTLLEMCGKTDIWQIWSTAKHTSAQYHYILMALSVIY
jgi:hypothetical protein